MKLIIHTDGGARGNRETAAVGVVIEEETSDKRQEIAAFGKQIGETTNNIAEYTGVIEALVWITEHKKYVGSNVSCYLDSTLVVNQLNGLFKVKEPHLRELLMKVRTLEQDTSVDIQYAYVPREQNSRADYFVNKALDAC